MTREEIFKQMGDIETDVESLVEYVFNIVSEKDEEIARQKRWKNDECRNNYLLRCQLQEKDAEIAELKKYPLYSLDGDAATKIGNLQSKLDKAVDTIALILPLAKGYVANNCVGSNEKYIQEAEEAIDALKGDK